MSGASRRTAYAIPVCILAAAISMAGFVVCIGVLVHWDNGQLPPMPKLIGGVVLLMVALISSLPAFLLGVPGRTALLVGVASCAAVYLAVLAVAPDRTQREWWWSVQGDSATGGIVAEYSPVLLLDGNEQDDPWMLPARVFRDGPFTIIEYWWAFKENRSPSLEDAACLPILAVRYWTCFDHDGDLEGVSVILKSGRPVRVDYAAHSDVIRVNWSKLRQDGRLEGRHPRVHVARGSHASYPNPCRRSCVRARSGWLGFAGGEANHDGSKRAVLAPAPAAIPGRPQCLLRGLCVRGDDPVVVSGRPRRGLQ